MTMAYIKPVFPKISKKEVKKTKDYYNFINFTLVFFCINK